MKRQLWGSLRLRLMLLVVLAVIPAVALLVYSNFQDRQLAIAQAKTQVMEAAGMASRGEARTIRQARQLLMTLSHFPPVQQQEAAACNKIFARLLHDTAGFSSFNATGTDGITFASAPFKKHPVNLSDRLYLKEAIRTGEFMVGKYVLGRITGQPVLPMAYPVKNDAGKVIATLVSGLKTDWLGELLAQAQLPPDAHLAVIDGQGHILAHNPPEPGLIGKPQFSQAIIKQIAAKEKGVYQGVDSQGNKRIFGFTRLGKAPGAIYVLFSVPEKAVFVEADRTLTRDLILVGVVALLALLVAWFMGAASVVKPVQRLLGITQQVAAGDLEARAGEGYGASELGQLAKGFDAMASALQQRQKEQKQAQETLRESEVRFQTVADFTYDWEWWRGMDGEFIYVSPSCKRITGYELEEFFEDKDLLLCMVHPEDKHLVESHLRSDLYHDQPINLDFRITTKDGRTIWIEHISQAVHGPDGEPLGRRASNRDGTERRKAMDELAEQNQLKTSQAELSDLLRGNLDVKELSRRVVTFLCEHLGLPVGLVYLGEEDGTLQFTAGYAYQGSLEPPAKFAPGQGLVGQAALERRDITVNQVPEGYLSVSSGLGQAPPRNIHLKPVVHEDRVMAVLELGSLGELNQYQASFLDSMAEGLAISLHSAESRTKLARALEEAQAMSEELQVQQEELKTTNEELEEQTHRLKTSEEKLRAQQEELQVTNEELEEKNELLSRQKNEVEWARKDLQEKAEELALASKYKSEFLANMSHELRTPLNSLLLLAQVLVENKDGNLNDEQVEFASIIHSSGSDLLNLINEILDLAKIEAGRVDLQPGKVETDSLAEGVRSSFEHMARQGGLELEVVVEPEAPAEFYSDRKRIEQILRNLISNAIKFTEAGQVRVAFQRPQADFNHTRLGLSDPDCLAVSVQDTGIGIDTKHQKVIFEAFQQVDGSTSRRYGGTGLGLSISRELVNLLGGAIELQSEPGKGSTFTVYLPVRLPPESTAKPTAAAKTAGRREAAAPPGSAKKPEAEAVVAAAAPHIPDDREALSPEDRIIVIIEDDPKFAKILYGKCHEKGFKCLAASTGEDGLHLVQEHLPDAVILDLHLPVLDGWSVLEAIKENTSTRHIPVHIISIEQASAEAFRKGAVGHASKPIDSERLEQAFAKLEEMATQGSKRILVVEDNAQQRHNTVALIGGKDVEVDEAESAAQALDALRAIHYDCVVLDLGLPDMDGHELLKKLRLEGKELPPVIVHTAREVTREEEVALRENAESIIIKDVRSQERLLDEVSLFLHRMVSEMPPTKRQIIRNLHEGDALLAGKKVLVVDDDMRTTFAVAALLSDLGMKPFKAQNGQKALQVLEEEPNVDLVLMDIMMPVMDGYQAMERIRAQERFSGLPIIALTAKAMPADREKCLAAGANDYLPKPVDKGKLVSMIRVWLYR